MNRTAEWTDWLLNIVTGLAIFVGGSVVYEHEFVSARAEIAAVLTLDPDGGMPALTEEEFATMDMRFAP
jgi:hypothetical protein